MTVKYSENVQWMWIANEPQKNCGHKIAIFYVWKTAQKNKDKLCEGHVVWKHENVSFASDVLKQIIHINKLSWMLSKKKIVLYFLS